MGSTGSTGSESHVAPEVLSAWLDGELSAPEAARAQAHVVDCDDCRALAGDLRALAAATREVEVPAVPRDLAGRISDRIARRGAGAAPNVSLPRRRFVPVTAAASLAAAVLLAVFFIEQRKLGVAPSATGVRPPQEDIAQSREPLPPPPASPGLHPGRDIAEPVQPVAKDSQRGDESAYSDRTLARERDREDGSRSVPPPEAQDLASNEAHRQAKPEDQAKHDTATEPARPQRLEEVATALSRSNVASSSAWVPVTLGEPPGERNERKDASSRPVSAPASEAGDLRSSAGAVAGPPASPACANEVQNALLLLWPVPDEPSAMRDLSERSIEARLVAGATSVDPPGPFLDLPIVRGRWDAVLAELKRLPIEGLDALPAPPANADCIRLRIDLACSR